MSSKPHVLGIIPARGGSKGLPGKNIRPLGGLPLIAHTVLCAKASGIFTAIVTSTDDPTTREIAQGFGSDAPFLRPAELSTDAANIIPVLQHAVVEMEKFKGLKFDIVVLLQPTSPLKMPSDLRIPLTEIVEGRADSAIGIVHVDNWHPMKMKKFVGNWLVDYEKPPMDNPARQSLPPVYMVNGVIYAVTRDLLFANRLKGDRCFGHIMPVERSSNIDTEADFVVAEYYYAKNRDSYTHLKSQI